MRATGFEGKWTAAVGLVPILNHFVIGVASGRAAASDVEPAVVGAAVVDSASCAKRAALRAGWILKTTVSDGDCGPDVMAYHLGLPRNIETWAGLREAIADFMFLNSDSES